MASKAERSETPEYNIDRRTLVAGIGAVVTGSVVGSGMASGATPAAPAASVSEHSVAQTRAGKVRGTHRGGIHIFKGIPYGEDTAKSRFLAAVPVRKWDGIRDALEFGDQCLQPATPDFELLRSGWDQPGTASEDCLNLNVWTPGLDDGRKRPVMVNMHGGGFTVGSGNSAGRSGENFARTHDIVRVNVNHRLGIFGFSQMAEKLGPDYAGSGSVGLQDIVLALEWVRDNIAGFGGDPDNVTIFGVSGGGGKVSALMAMPGAKGLFTKASMESGSMLMAKPPEMAVAPTEKLFDTLKITDGNERDILSMSGEQLMAAYMTMYPDGGLVTSGIAPVVDGVHLPHHPFHPSAPEISSLVPMLVGTTATESSIFPEIVGGPQFDLSWDEVAERLPKLLPPGLKFTADEILAKTRALIPDASPTEALFKITTESFFRRAAIRQAELASARPGQVFMWRIDWPVPTDGGKWGAPHGLSVPLVMGTVEAASAMFGEGMDDARALSAKMTAAWAAFARTGAPDTSEIPHWPAYGTSDRKTMIFDMDCHVVADPDAEFRQMFAF